MNCFLITGGTVDITAHELTDSGELIRHCEDTMDDITGSEVDKNFLVWLSEIVGDCVMKSLSTEDMYMDSYFEILREIEKFKRNILASGKEKIFFDIPFSNLDTLCQTYNNKSLRKTIESSKYSREISLKGDHIIFLRSSLLLLFLTFGNRIATKIQHVMDELTDFETKMILMVGGLSISPAIVKKIDKSFKSMTIVKLPQKYPADLAVVMGAVLIGHRTHFITSRITEYVYCCVVQPTFENQEHDHDIITTANEKDMDKDVFEILVKKNIRVSVNEKIRKEYKEMPLSYKRIRIAVYTTKKVKYIYDAECQLLCEVFVPFSEYACKPPSVTVDFIFGYTEFHVTAFDNETGLKYEESVDFK